MILLRMELDNYRSYRGEQVIDLAPCAQAPDKNIVAIGGLNGAGKTSLLEAIVFTLLGVNDAHKFMDGMSRKGEGKEHLDRTLDGLLNREAREAGEREASVTLFLKHEGKLLAVNRTWFYDWKGKFKEERLALKLDGLDIDPEHYDDYLMGTVPPQIARFFFFDGEKIQEIASDEVGTSVLEGIDLLLGFHVLDDLVKDMDELQDKYQKQARKRNRQEEELSELRTDDTRLTNQIRELEEEKLEFEEQIQDLRERSNELVEELNELLGGQGSSPKELHKRLEETNGVIRELKEQLANDVERCVTPSLPAELVKTLAEQLTGEELLSQWDEGKRRVQPQRNRLLDRVLGRDAPVPLPPLTGAQVEFLTGRIRDEWDELFNPPPAGIAKQVIHAYLSAEERSQVRGKCSQLMRSGAVDVRGVLNRLDSSERKARELRQQLDRIGDGEKANEIIEEKTRVDRELGEAEQKWESHKRRVQALLIDQKDIRQKMRKKEDDLLEAGESTDRASFVRKVKRVVQQYQEALRPRKRDEVARHLTEMYRHLARKEDVVDRIELDEKTYRPRLLDRRGKVMPLHSLSAGEREIYALSLLWALAKTSRRELPVVIDTPLARLDSKHRASIVKRYLPEAGPQVIVLSTDTELDREYFELIQSRVAVALRLEFDPATECTTVNQGFFN